MFLELMAITKLHSKIFDFLERKFLKIEKRVRFAISTVLISFLMLFSTFFFFDKVWIFLPLLTLSSYVLTYFSVLEEIEKIEWITLFIMPIALTISFYLFYFLFPGRWLTRLPFIIIFSVSYYATLLSSNIFNVGVEKNLQLYRAAFSINFFYQTLIAFLLFNNFFSLKLNFFYNGILTGVVSFLLALQLIWTVRLNLALEEYIIRFSLLIALVIFELGVALSFVPLASSIFALFLSAAYYCLAGVIFHYYDQSLFKETIREYLTVLAFVGIITLLSISW